MFRSVMFSAAIIMLTAFTTMKYAKQESTLFGTKWLLQAVHQGDQVLTPEGETAFLRINEEKKSAGGNGGCNAFGSTATIHGNTIQISDLFSTKMYCDGIQGTEDAFFHQLSSANRFEIKGEKLFLFKDKELLLEFSK